MSSDTTNNEDGDVLRIAAVQPPLRRNSVSPLEAARNVERMMREAAAAETTGIDLYVLPELCPIGYSEQTFGRYLPGKGSGTENLSKLNAEIELLFANFARDHNAYVCFGAVGETGPTSKGGSKESTAMKRHAPITEEGEGSALTIRQIVLDSKGDRIAQYDKMHLCDYGDCAETRFFTPGSQLCSLDCRGFRVGIIICADMRNPTLSRELAGRHGVDAIIQPAAFSRDISFRTWRSFRETRAVENSVYFVGVNYSGDYYGETSFVGPWVDQDHEPVLMGTEEGVLVGTIDRSTLNKVREDMPYYRQLQSELCDDEKTSPSRK